MPTIQSTASGWLQPGTRTARRELALGLALAAMTAVAAQIRIPLPFTPVPLTLQILAVLAAGYLLRPLAAAGAMAAYLLAGTAGLPVFSGAAAGVGILAGATGGYLLAMPLAALLVSSLAHDSSRVSRRLAAGVAGLALVHASGALWLALVASPVVAGTGSVLSMSLLPFMAADLAKLAVAEWSTRPHPRSR